MIDYESSQLKKHVFNNEQRCANLEKANASIHQADFRPTLTIVKPHAHLTAHRSLLTLLHIPLYGRSKRIMVKAVKDCGKFSISSIYMTLNDHMYDYSSPGQSSTLLPGSRPHSM